MLPLILLRLVLWLLQWLLWLQWLVACWRWWWAALALPLLLAVLRASLQPLALMVRATGGIPGAGAGWSARCAGPLLHRH